MQLDFYKIMQQFDLIKSFHAVQMLMFTMTIAFPTRCLKFFDLLRNRYCYLKHIPRSIYIDMSNYLSHKMGIIIQKE